MEFDFVKLSVFRVKRVIFWPHYGFVVLNNIILNCLSLILGKKGKCGNRGLAALQIGPAL